MLGPHWEAGIWHDYSDFNSENAEVFALAVNGTNLVAGGYFNAAGEVRADCIAKWNGSEWSAFGNGIVGWPNFSYGVGVYSLALYGNDLYLGGFFTTYGKVKASSIVKWDGNGWSALGTGLSSDDPYYIHPWVNALAVDGTNLYVGGLLHEGGRRGGQQHRQMERQRLVRLGRGDLAG